MITLILTILGSIIAITEISFAIYKYVKEVERNKCKDTIEIFNKLFDDTYSLREDYLLLFSEPLFEANNICNNKILYKSTMQVLTQWESFARGLYYNVYDFRIFIYLTPRELSEILNSLEDFVNKQRIEKRYERLFKDFTYLNHDISICIQTKLDGKEIPANYKKIRRLK